MTGGSAGLPMGGPGQNFSAGAFLSENGSPCVPDRQQLAGGSVQYSWGSGGALWPTSREGPEENAVLAIMYIKFALKMSLARLVCKKKSFVGGP